MNKYRVRVKKESYGWMTIEADDQQEALNIADELLESGDEPYGTWDAESAEACDVKTEKP